MALSMRNSVARPTLGVARRSVVCAAVKPDTSEPRMPVMLASALAAVMISGAVVTDDAIAASSGGRAGGSRFSSSRMRSAPSAGYSAAPRMSNTTVVVGAPPVYGGFSPFGFGGFGYGVPMFSPFGFGIGFGSMLQLFFLFAVVSVVLNVINSVGSGPGSKKKNDDDGWGDL